MVNEIQSTNHNALENSQLCKNQLEAITGMPQIILFNFIVK